MRRLRIGDRHLRVRDEGDGGAHAPLLLVHGAGGSSVAWMDLVRRLAPRRRVIAPDLPGHGQSDPWRTIAPGDRGDAALLELYRDAVGTVAAALGVGRAVLVGHSMGGAIALRAALAWPERVAALVVVSCGARLRVDADVLAALAADLPGARVWQARLCFSPSTPRDVVDRWSAVGFTAPDETVLADFGAVDGFDVRAELARLSMPLLAVGGADDLLVPPRRVEELARLAPNARAVVLPGAAHLPVQEQPDAFARALDGFLAEVA